MIDCSGLDTACRVYQVLTANRCAGLGACKTANDPAACTEYSDLPCADGGVTQQDGGGTQPGPDGGTTGDKSGGCRAAPRGPANGFVGLALLALGLGVARRRR
jgi:MYXO-CTERM domain-containing protein